MALFLVTKDEILWDLDYNKYYSEDPYKRYRISRTNYVIVEIVPPNNNYKLPIEKWRYYISWCQKQLPKWYTNEKYEELCRKNLKIWYAEKVIKRGNHTFSGKVNKIIFGGNVTINDLESNSEIRIYGKSNLMINNMKGGFINFYDYSTGTLNNQTGGNSSFGDNSTGTLNNKSGGVSWFYDNSTGTLNNKSGEYVSFNHNSTGTLNNQSGGYVNFYDECTGEINNHIGGKVEFFDNSKQTTDV